jgi:addiction module HigA family antidote
MGKVFAVHPGEILKTEFMEPMGVSAYELTKALNFPRIYEVVRGDRAISADTAIRLGKVLRSARAVLAQSSERLRSENRRRQRDRQRCSAPKGWLRCRTQRALEYWSLRVFPIPMGWRLRDNEKMNLFAGVISHLMRGSRRNPKSLAGSQNNRIALHFHDGLAREHIEKLLRVMMEMANLRRICRHALLNYA